MTLSSNRPRVFVVNQPTGRDLVTGQVVPTMDLSPAEEWGDLVFLMRETENPFRAPTETAVAVAQALEEADYWEDDYLLLVGSPVLIGLVAACAALVCPRMNLLQWDRARARYNVAPVLDMDAVLQSLEDPDAEDWDPDDLLDGQP